MRARIPTMAISKFIIAVLAVSASATGTDARGTLPSHSLEHVRVSTRALNTVSMQDWLNYRKGVPTYLLSRWACWDQYPKNRPEYSVTIVQDPTMEEEEATTPPTTPTVEESSATGCSDDAMDLVSLVNAYRAENGKAAIAASTSMFITADAHVADSISMGTDNGDCNLHNWLDCCYTADHANPECMWDKPSMCTCYTGYGFENSAWSSSGSLSPADALDMWKGSSGHNDVILNLGSWADNEFQAMGAGFGGGFAHLWFGMEPDCQ